MSLTRPADQILELSETNSQLRTLIGRLKAENERLAQENEFLLEECGNWQREVDDRRAEIAELNKVLRRWEAAG